MHNVKNINKFLFFLKKVPTSDYFFEKSTQNGYKKQKNSLLKYI